MTNIHTRLYILKVSVRGSATQEFSLTVRANTFTGTPIVLDASDSADTAEVTLVREEDDAYLINVKNMGVLSVESMVTDNATPDLKGELRQDDTTVATHDDIDPATDKDFRLVQSVNPGFYVLRVSGYDAMQTGAYTLKTVFIAALAEVPVEVPTEPMDLAMACTDAGLGYTMPTQASCEAAGVITTVTETVTVPRSCPSGGGGGTRTVPPSASSCQSFSTAAVETYKDSLTVTTDALGVLENPSGNGYRSGIGVISGWVLRGQLQSKCAFCDDQGPPGAIRQHVGYGTSRPDVQMVGPCAIMTSDTVGFGLTYNFNHLDEGSYTIAAYADGNTMIGMRRGPSWSCISKQFAVRR